jgi:spermidine synthase
LRRRLAALVLIAGTGSVATEIAASRLLAPYYGASTVVWANVIGLVLAALALGYWLGGRLADRRPQQRLLGWIVVAAAVLTAAIPFVAQPLLDVTARGLDEVGSGSAIGSFLAALALFAPPVTLLGMVSPFAIRLATEDAAEAGAVAGRFFALSTVGSLVGVFVPALVTIPLVGTQRTFLGAAALLALAGALVLGARWLLVAAALAALLLVPPGAVKAADGLLYEAESRYQYVQVVERGDARYLHLNEGVAVHSVWRREHVLTGGEWDMFLVAPALLDRRVRDVAILGNAGGTTARAFGRYYPEARIDGVELDAKVTQAGRRFLGLGDNPRLRVVTADARPFLRTTRKRYDLILVDAYRQPYVPFYLATREFFRLVRDRLRPGGVVALNVAAVPGDHRLARDVAGTMAWELPRVERWRALRFNELVVGTSGGPALRRAPLGLEPLLDLFRRERRPAARIARPWTDDRAPVEWITDRMILAYGLSGPDLTERWLPTHP